MKYIKKIIYALILISSLNILVSCDRTVKLSEADIETIHKTVTELKSFTTEITYLTELGSITVAKLEENYECRIHFTSALAGTYTYVASEEKIYKDKDVIVENITISSNDEFAAKMCEFMNSSSYISINEYYVPLRKYFLEATSIVANVNGGRIDVTIEVPATDLIGDDQMPQALLQIINGLEIESPQTAVIDLLFDSSYKKAFPQLSIAFDGEKAVEYNFEWFNY